MIKQPANTDELYAFFVPNLIKPPGKSNYVCSGIHLDRTGWHIDIYHRHKNDTMDIWFYPHPMKGPKWVVCYDKFTNPS